MNRSNFANRVQSIRLTAARESRECVFTNRSVNFQHVVVVDGRAIGLRTEARHVKQPRLAQIKKNSEAENGYNRAHCKPENITPRIKVTMGCMYVKKQASSFFNDHQSQIPKT